MNLIPHLCITLAQAAPTNTGDDTQWMVYAIIAFAMAVALIIMEAFLPSGGVLGILAGVAAIAGVMMFFQFDTLWGMVSMAVTLAAMPFIVAGMLWVWPNTPIGRALTLDDEQQRVNPDGPDHDPEAPDAIAVGTEGETLTELRPVGACRLNGKRVDCIAQAGVIEPGTKVKVIRVEGTDVRVKPVC